MISSFFKAMNRSNVRELALQKVLGGVAGKIAGPESGAAAEKLALYIRPIKGALKHQKERISKRLKEEKETQGKLSLKGIGNAFADKDARKSMKESMNYAAALGHMKVVENLEFDVWGTNTPFVTSEDAKTMIEAVQSYEKDENLEEEENIKKSLDRFETSEYIPNNKQEELDETIPITKQNLLEKVDLEDSESVKDILEKFKITDDSESFSEKGDSESYTDLIKASIKEHVDTFKAGLGIPNNKEEELVGTKPITKQELIEKELKEQGNLGEFLESFTNDPPELLQEEFNSEEEQNENGENYTHLTDQHSLPPENVDQMSDKEKIKQFRQLQELKRLEEEEEERAIKEMIKNQKQPKNKLKNKEKEEEKFGY